MAVHCGGKISPVMREMSGGMRGGITVPGGGGGGVTDPDPLDPEGGGGGGGGGGAGGGGGGEAPGKYKNPEFTVLLVPFDWPIAGWEKELHSLKLAEDPYPPPPLSTGSRTMKLLEEKSVANKSRGAKNKNARGTMSRSSRTPLYIDSIYTLLTSPSLWTG